TARCPSEQGPFGLEFKPLDLLAYRRLRQVEPLRGAVETSAIGHGNESAQQFEIQHAIDPALRSIILQNIVSIINDGHLPFASRTAMETIMSDTSRHRANRASRLARAAALNGMSGKVCPANLATRLLEAII